MKSDSTFSQAAQAGRKRVFVVEDHPIMREGVCALLNLHPELAVCGEAGDAPTALARIALAQPDLVLVDLSLSRGSGLELIKALSSKRPRIRSLVLSMHDEADYLERALRAGAGGFLAKDEAPQQLVQAVCKVLQGELYLSPQARAYLNGRERERRRLSRKRRHNARSLAIGLL
jgi:DNA-binding NarL/FixJ family response regulator